MCHGSYNSDGNGTMYLSAEASCGVLGQLTTEHSRPPLAADELVSSLIWRAIWYMGFPFEDTDICFARIHAKFDVVGGGGEAGSWLNSSGDRISEKDNAVVSSIVL